MFGYMRVLWLWVPRMQRYGAERGGGCEMRCEDGRGAVVWVVDGG